ncbi:hypothetical protein CALCODRAFT_558295 [Calocera cornea HHB12733]|uniref:F-box domain-containing protein n=1 Tax=Calocera cornea HHB12733 TaxID=1353952 RepID=A0A165D480_9BASI|nr:hypothetical protein CALCODRAFT_558295 [Calocera cornea HHB12733]
MLVLQSPPHHPLARYTSRSVLLALATEFPARHLRTTQCLHRHPHLSLPATLSYRPTTCLALATTPEWTKRRSTVLTRTSFYIRSTTAATSTRSLCGQSRIHAAVGEVWHWSITLFDRLDRFIMERWLDVWLRRTGSEHALDIMIDLHDMKDWPTVDVLSASDIEYILRAVCHVASRWRSFTYTLGDYAVPTWPVYKSLRDAFGANFRSMPFLHSIHLEQGTNVSSVGLTPKYIYSLFKCTKEAPLLRSIVLCNASSYVALADFHITHLAYTMSRKRLPEPRHLLWLLWSCPSLTSLWLSGWASSSNQVSRPVMLPHLKTLTVVPNRYMAPVLRYFPIPLLEELIVDAKDIPGDEQIGKQLGPPTPVMSQLDHYNPTFLDDIASNQFSVPRNLALHLPFREIPWEAIVRIPTLQRLRIVKPAKDDFWLLCPSNLSALHKKTKLGDGPLGWALPYLHTLILEVTTPYDTAGFGLTAGWRHRVAATKEQFTDRWEAARGSQPTISALVIQLVGPSWSAEIRDTVPPRTVAL